MAEEVSEEQQLASAYGIEQLQNNPQSQEVVPTAEAHTVASATTAPAAGRGEAAAGRRRVGRRTPENADGG